MENIRTCLQRTRGSKKLVAAKAHAHDAWKGEDVEELTGGDNQGGFGEVESQERGDQGSFVGALSTCNIPINMQSICHMPNILISICLSTCKKNGSILKRCVGEICFYWGLLLVACLLLACTTIINLSGGLQLDMDIMYNPVAPPPCFSSL